MRLPFRKDPQANSPQPQAASHSAMQGASQVPDSRAAESELEPGVDEAEAGRARTRRRLWGASVLVGLGVLLFSFLFETSPRSTGQTRVSGSVSPAPALPSAAAPTAPPAPATVQSTAAAAAVPAAPSAANNTTAGTSGSAAPSAATAATATAAALATAAAIAAAPPRVKVDEAPPAKPEAGSQVKPQAKAEVKPEPKPEVKPPAVAQAPVAPAKPELKPSTAPAAPTAPAAAKPSAALPTAGAAAAAAAAPAAATAESGGRFVVQVGAFAEAKTLREVRQRVEGLKLKTYTQVVETPGGQRTRVRVGPYASKAEAEAAQGKIKAAGISGSAVLEL